jgi:hypothetical protein
MLGAIGVPLLDVQAMALAAFGNVALQLGIFSASFQHFAPRSLAALALR